MAASGFLLAAAHFKLMPFSRLAALLFGMSLVIAAACVFNNFIDRGLDQKMSRTEKRALVTRQIGGPAALAYGALLGAAGFFILIVFTNHRVVWLNLLAILSYVFLYGYAKRKTVHGTLVGTIPGAIPPVAGYAALAPLDKGALGLFLILVFWQMAHFYSIAMHRFKDYRAAGLPVMPVKYSMRITKIQIVLYVLALLLATISLTVFGYDGVVFLVVCIGLCAYWLYKGLSNFDQGDEMWGKQMFLSSLIVLIALAAFIPLGALLP